MQLKQFMVTSGLGLSLGLSVQAAETPASMPAGAPTAAAGEAAKPLAQLPTIFVERLKEVGKLLKASDWPGGAWNEKQVEK